MKFYPSIVLFFLSLSIYGQPGSLDLTFGSAGKVITDLGMNMETALSVEIQSNGKIVVGGHSGNNSNIDFAVVRYNGDGTLDNTFGNGGKAITDLGSSADYCNAIAIQSDGKIIAAGGSNAAFALVRYNSNGSLDNTFGSGGIVTTAINGINDRGSSVAIQSDGKILVAGYSDTGSADDFAIVRYNTDGSLDTTFGVGGKTTTTFGSFSINAKSSIAIQVDGKIIMAGTANFAFGLVRYKSSGTLDNTFNSTGKVTTNFGSDQSFARSVTIQNDGKIVVAGNTWDGMKTDFALARYDTSGTLDNSFDSDGQVTTDLGDTSTIGLSVMIQSDGKIVVAGSAYDNYYDFALVRYTTSGSLDITFGSNGIVITDLGSAHDRAFSGAIQSDSKIVIVGNYLNGTNYNYDFAIARYDRGMVNIEENSEWNDMLVYPNPTAGAFQINYSSSEKSSLTLNIFDLNGKILYTEKFQGDYNNTIDLGTQAKSVYFIELLGDRKRRISQVVVK